MIQLDPLARPSLAEIKNHDWYNLPIPTQNEVREEFEDRKKAIEESRYSQDAETPEAIQDDEVYQKSKIHRGVDGDETTEADLASAERSLQEYLPLLSTPTQFFSNSPTGELFTILLESVNKWSSEFTISLTEYQVDFTIVENEIKAEVNASLLRAKEDGDKITHWVYFHKVTGDNFVFNKIYDQIRDYFGGHLNSFKPEEEQSEL